MKYLIPLILLGLFACKTTHKISTIQNLEKDSTKLSYKSESLTGIESISQYTNTSEKVSTTAFEENGRWIELQFEHPDSLTQGENKITIATDLQGNITLSTCTLKPKVIKVHERAVQANMVDKTNLHRDSVANTKSRNYFSEGKDSVSASVSQQSTTKDVTRKSISLWVFVVAGIVLAGICIKLKSTIWNKFL